MSTRQQFSEFNIAREQEYNNLRLLLIKSQQEKDVLEQKYIKLLEHIHEQIEMYIKKET